MKSAFYHYYFWSVKSKLRHTPRIKGRMKPEPRNSSFPSSSDFRNHSPNNYTNYMTAFQIFNRRRPDTNDSLLGSLVPFLFRKHSMSTIRIRRDSNALMTLNWATYSHNSTPVVVTFISFPYYLLL